MPNAADAINASFFLSSIFVKPNVEVNRSKEGAAPAPQETCLMQESGPTLGSALYSRLPEGAAASIHKQPNNGQIQKHTVDETLANQSYIEGQGIYLLIRTCKITTHLDGNFQPHPKGG